MPGSSLFSVSLELAGLDSSSACSVALLEDLLSFFGDPVSSGGVAY